MLDIYKGDAYQLLPIIAEEIRSKDIYKRIAIVTDPPYEVQSGGSPREYFKEIHKTGIARGFDFGIFYLIPEVKNIITFCSASQRHALENYLHSMQDLQTGKKLFDRVEELRWQKLNPAPWANNCYASDYEPWLHAWQKGHHPVGSFDDLRTHIATKIGGKSGYDHPTVKPMQVMVKAMKPLQADLIIDPFMGTGTTGVVAQQMGIDFIGIEIDDEFFEIARTRTQKPVDSGFIL